MAPLELGAGTALAEAHLQRPWRVRAGVLVVCQHSHDLGDRPQYLALPGDLIGLEQRVGVPAPSRVLTLAAATLVPLPAADAPPAPELLAQALAQARRQAGELQRLRTGLLPDRLLRLLAMLRRPGVADGEVEVPTLKQLSQLLEATPEAICRALTLMKQSDVLVAQSPVPRMARPRVRLVPRLAPAPGALAP